ncbi:winged helix-turn-helix domain-containing protein [Actinacidiphila alni]|uniref:winged helix-turn-helix domain-containing protein n=1 Tax=Actinacidiphila alni TaxID=380248 RepID=UPI0033F252E0
MTEKPKTQKKDAVPIGPLAEQDLVRLDARSLRGLAHPLRIRLLTALRDHGPATASHLAARLGESSGATSYHLRQLASFGLVEDDPGRGTARERWWKAAHRGQTFDSVEEFVRHPDPEVREAMSTFLVEHAASSAEQLATWMGTMHQWPQEWQGAWDSSRFTLRLTPEDARELSAQVHALVESFRTRETDGPDGERVRVQFHEFPIAAD